MLTQSVAVLNIDILSYVVPHLTEGRDVSSVMKTCKASCGFSIRHLLNPNRSEVFIYTPGQARSFCAFMLARPFSKVRFQYLLQLRIRCDFFTGALNNLALALVKIIQRAVNLETLFFQDFEILLGLSAGGTEIHTTLKDLTSHTKLTKLIVEGIAAKSHQLLSVMKSKSIAKLELSYDMGASFGPADPLPSLQTLRLTITSLTLEGASFRATGFQCPHVRTLTLYTTPPLSTRPIVHTFPNVLDLTLISIFEMPDDEEAFNIRETNLPSPSWPQLRRVVADPSGLYEMGLSCHVHDLSFDHVEVNDMDWILQSIEDVSPRLLGITIDTRSFPLPSLVYFLHDIVRQLQVCCTHFSIHFDLSDYGLSEYDNDVQEMMVSAVDRLRLFDVLTTFLFGCRWQLSLFCPSLPWNSSRFGWITCGKQPSAKPASKRCCPWTQTLPQSTSSLKTLQRVT